MHVVLCISGHPRSCSCGHTRFLFHALRRCLHHITYQTPPVPHKTKHKYSHQITMLGIVRMLHNTTYTSPSSCSMWYPLAISCDTPDASCPSPPLVGGNSSTDTVLATTGSVTPSSDFSLEDTINRLASGVTVAGDAVEAAVSGDFLKGRLCASAGGVATKDVKALRLAPACSAAFSASDPRANPQDVKGIVQLHDIFISGCYHFMVVLVYLVLEFDFCQGTVVMSSSKDSALMMRMVDTPNLWVACSRKSCDPKNHAKSR